jgi:3-hydroxy-9,10-secoandrosta-1,3,5(10)-triene-9,17-dione monooxygenase reductase component
MDRELRIAANTATLYAVDDTNPQEDRHEKDAFASRRHCVPAFLGTMADSASRFPLSPSTPSLFGYSTTMTHPRSATTPDSQTASATSAATNDGLATALARIPSGLFIVTWRDDIADHGMLASWVMQAGFSPPAVTVAVAPGRELLAAIDCGLPFVINILGDTQRPLLARFGRPAAKGEDPFADLVVQRTAENTPVLSESAGWLECRAAGRVTADGGDHVVVLATVTATGAGGDGQPLVHLRKNGLRY